MLALLDGVAGGSQDPSEKGPDVVIITLGWNDQTITGSYAKADAEINLRTDNDLFWETEELKPLLQALVDNGTPFVTQTGTGDSVCTLVWTIK
jgi:lysophospholipase L1-like esterase